MSDELVFYTNPMSRGRIVRWILEEIGDPYRTEIVEYGAPMKAAAYLTINPMGKVPAIVHNGRTVTECAAICAYLADACPTARLAPPPELRHQYYRWLFFFAGPVEAALMNRGLGLDLPRDKERMIGYGTYETVIDVLEQTLSQSDYIAGDAFTAADVYCGSQIGWGLQFGTIDKRGAFEAYWDRLNKREALHRAVAIDDALIPPKS